jgi:hypothetical protein
MSDHSSKVPEAAVVVAFAGVMAVSPSIYQSMLEDLALQYAVPCDETFKSYVTAVLSKQSSTDFD